MYRFYRRLSSFCRVIRFDHRGMGMSSRIGGGQDHPGVLGRGRGRGDGRGRLRARHDLRARAFTAMSALFLAADRPERVANLVIVNGSARALWAPDYEVGHAGQRRRLRSRRWRWSPTPSSRASTSSRSSRRRSPRDQAFRTWWDAAGNRAASPSMARRSNQALDRRRRARQAAAHHRADPGPASRGRRVRRRSGTAATSPSTSRVPATSNCRAPTRCTGSATPRRSSPRSRSSSPASRGGSDAERVLTTIVFTDIVGSTAARRRARRRPLARPARQPRQRGPPRARALRRSRSQHGR